MELEIWSHYIKAQNSLINKLCAPINLLPVNGNINSKGIIKLELDKKIHENDILHLIATTFKGINQEDINIKKGFFVIDNDKIPASNVLEKFKSEAEKLYIDFKPFPTLEGFIIDNSSPFSLLKKELQAAKIDLDINQDGDIMLPIKGIEIFDKIKSLKRNEKIGAIFQLKAAYDTNIKIKIENLLEGLGIKKEDYNIVGNRIYFNQMLLSREQFLTLSEQIGLQIINETLRVWVGKNIDDEKLKKLPTDFSSNIQTDSNGNLYIDFPTKSNNLIFEGQKGTDEEYLLLSYFSVKYHLGVENIIKAEKKYTFSFDNQASFFDDVNNLDLDEDGWNKIKSQLDSAVYSYNTLRNSVSFDFTDTKDFDEKFAKIKEIDWIEVCSYRDNHKFKVKAIINDDNFGLLQKDLEKRFGKNNLRFKKNDHGRELRMRYNYQLSNDESDKKLQFLNFFNSKNNSIFDLKLEEQYKIKFTFEINDALKEFEESTKYNKIRGAEIKLNNTVIGTLKRAKFPYIELQINKEYIFSLNQELEENHDFLNKIQPVLTGDIEKIFRLQDTMDKITQRSSEISNKNLVKFLFDSSKAKVNDKDIFNSDSEEWKDIEKHKLSSFINASQLEAVLKTLYAEDLAIIQGPPGTGKSTAISEIIWQHIRKNTKEKILLTSETNLAVDNAMEKLISSHTNLVKPIRMGNDDKLEEEGARFSLNRIVDWANEVVQEKDVNDNIVVKWMANIANKSYQRSEAKEDEQLANLIGKWNNCLKKPVKETKILFKNTYIDNANVLGATCSSIAEKTSEGKRASFAWNYHSIFNRQYLEDFKEGLSFSAEARSDAFWLASDKINKTKFEFNVVIMDEASKATPPEFALPLLYGKKSIIIGDHRQLPPMLDGNDFATTLEMIGEKDLAIKFRKADHNISHFETLFLNPNIDNKIKASFDTQYRMHPQINNVIKQFYIKDKGLNCGLDPLQVDDPNLNNPVSRYHGFNYEDFINPNTHVIWVNVDTPELLEGTSRVNFGEVDACRKVLNYLAHSDNFEQFQEHWTKPEDKEIGLISFYGRQLFYLEQMSRELEVKIPIRIRTVDRFQGMERNIVMVSMVRSNKIATDKEQEADYETYPDLGFPKQNSLGFAEFPNRLNVALSRAKRLLVIVGNKEHFCQHEIYKNVYQTIENSDFGKIIDYKDLKNF